MLLIEAAKSDLSLKNADNVDLFNLLQIILDREITRDEAREDNKDADENALLSNFLDKEYLTALEYIIPFQVLAHLTAMDLGLSTVYSYRELFYPNLDKVKIRIDE